MSNNFTLSSFAAVPWGDGPFAIPLVLQDYPLFSEFAPQQMRKVRAPVRIRLDACGGLHVLVDATLHTTYDGVAYIYHFDATGKLRGHTPLLPGDHADGSALTIEDYVVDNDGNCYLLQRARLEQFRQSRNRLLKISAAGEVLWSREGPTASDEFDVRTLKGTFTRLLMDGRSRLYLPLTEHTGSIAELDSATGVVAHLYTSEKFSRIVFMNEQGQVLYVLYFPDLNRRGIGLFNLVDQSFKSLVGDVELYGWLLSPFGVDTSSNVYAWKDSTMARISSGGRIDVLATLDNLVIRSADGAIFSSLFRAAAGQFPVIQVTGHTLDGKSSCRELPLPVDLSARSSGNWRLIHIDAQESYYVFGGEEPGQAGTLLVYTNKGDLTKRISPPPDLLPLESTLENHVFWDVDASGHIYLPVIDPQGLTVMRFTGPRRSPD